jgi:hypothetical protein
MQTYKHKKMKTKMNISQLASMSFTSSIILVFSTLATVKANDIDEQEAFARLENMNLRIEASMKYKAPALTDIDTFVYSESEAIDTDVKAAAERLEELTLAIEESIKYNVPEVTGDIETYEVQTAKERLENLSLTVEESIRFKVSDVNEEVEAYELAVDGERLEDMNLAIE